MRCVGVVKSRPLRSSRDVTTQASPRIRRLAAWGCCPRGLRAAPAIALARATRRLPGKRPPRCRRRGGNRPVAPVAGHVCREPKQRNAKGFLAWAFYGITICDGFTIVGLVDSHTVVAPRG